MWTTTPEITLENQRGDAWVVSEYVTGRWQVEIARDLGLSQAQVCHRIERFCSSLGCHVKYKHYGPQRMAAAREALARYQGEIVPPQPLGDYEARLVYAQARYEHAWLLRAEGLTLQQIADRIGLVSRERVRQIICQFGRRVQRATRKTRFKIIGGTHEQRG